MRVRRAPRSTSNFTGCCWRELLSESRTYRFILELPVVVPAYFIELYMDALPADFSGSGYLGHRPWSLFPRRPRRKTLNARFEGKHANRRQDFRNTGKRVPNPTSPRTPPGPSFISDARPTPPLVVVPWEEAWGPWPHAPDEDVEHIFESRKTPFCTKRSRARRRTSSSTRESARIADYHPHHVVCAQNT